MSTMFFFTTSHHHLDTEVGRRRCDLHINAAAMTLVAMAMELQTLIFGIPIPPPPPFPQLTLMGSAVLSRHLITGESALAPSSY